MSRISWSVVAVTNRNIGLSSGSDSKLQVRSLTPTVSLESDPELTNSTHLATRNQPFRDQNHETGVSCYEDLAEVVLLQEDALQRPPPKPQFFLDSQPTRPYLGASSLG